MIMRTSRKARELGAGKPEERTLGRVLYGRFAELGYMEPMQ
jgi:hypothetical protein